VGSISIPASASFSASGSTLTIQQKDTVSRSGNTLREPGVKVVFGNTLLNEVSSVRAELRVKVTAGGDTRATSVEVEPAINYNIVT
jgi:hypothetical protein